MHELLRGMGLTSIHHPGQVSDDYITSAAPICTDIDKVYQLIKPLFEQADAFSDTPFNIFYRRQFEDFPDSKFIAVYRSPAAWIKSIQRHTGGRKFGPFERTQYSFITGQDPRSIEEISNLELTEVYYRYYTEMIAFFRSQDPSRLLVVDLIDPDLPRMVAEFIGLDVGALEKLPHITD